MNDQHVADLDDEFERLGRQAGAELRVPAPEDGAVAAQQSARRRRTTARVGAAVATAGTAALVVIGLLAITRPADEPLFALGDHASSLSLDGIPWFAHATAGPAGSKTSPPLTRH